MDARLKKFPADWVEHINNLYPKGLLHEIWQGYFQTKPTTLRINTLKVSQENAEKQMSKAGIKWERLALPLAYEVSGISYKKLTSLDLYRDGAIYLQSLASQIPAIALSPQPGELVLDLCASPGGKTTQMAALMKNQGEVIAIEPDPIRFARLNKNIEHQGAQIVKTINTRGESFCRNYLENNSPLFDRILIDAPCSGDGTFYLNEPISYTHWNWSFVDKVSKLQKKLIERALKILKPCGYIVYSTCSTPLLENEDLVEFISHKSKNLQLQQVKDKNLISCLRNSKDLFSHIKHKNFVSKTYRVVPNVKNEGFFLALWQKSELQTNAE